ncbi:MAG: hypothetical protein AAFP68_03175 [Pseudomonadota bacterium]
MDMINIAEIENGLAPETLDQLRAVPIIPGRPLIAVDVDEVLVVFVDHLTRWMETIGFEMRLVTYQLEGSMFPKGSDDPLPFEDCIGLIRRFFAEQTLEQRAIPGGAKALERLSTLAQIVILTNVPRPATDLRRQNLDALGIPFPMVVNQGGKGRALAWLRHAAQAPVGFIDDSVTQIESAAKWLPQAARIHFAWADFIDRIFPDCPDATSRARDWEVAEAALRRQMDLGETTP